MSIGCCATMIERSAQARPGRRRSARRSANEPHHAARGAQLARYLAQGHHRLRAMRKKRRVLVLMHEELVPPDSLRGQYAQGHRRVPHRARRDRGARGARPRSASSSGVGSDLGPIRAGVRRARAGHRVQPARRLRRRRHLRPARRRLPRAAAQALHRLQPARHDARARQGAVQGAARPITASASPRFAVFPVGKKARKPREARLSARGQVAQRRGLARHLAGVARDERREAERARRVHARARSTST